MVIVPLLVALWGCIDIVVGIGLILGALILGVCFIGQQLFGWRRHKEPTMLEMYKAQCAEFQKQREEAPAKAEARHQARLEHKAAVFADLKAQGKARAMQLIKDEQEAAKAQKAPL